jgi:hypothetical protein
MSKIAAAIVFTLLTVLSGAAHAIPRTITEGFVFSFGFAADTFFDFKGDGFQVSGFTGLAFGFPDVYTSGVIAFGWVNAFVTVGAVTCSPDDLGTPEGVGCPGDIQLMNTPIPPPDFDTTAFHVGSAPFTAFGRLIVGDGVAFVGRGIVEATWCPNCEPTPAIPNIRWTFSVDEPPTLLLFGTSLGVVGALFSARLLRARSAARLPEHPW